MLIPQILSFSILSEDFYSQVFPYLEEKFFELESHKILFKILKTKRLTFDELKLEVSENQKISKMDTEKCFELINELQIKLDIDQDLLLEKAEEFVKRKSIEHAIYDSVEILTEQKKPISLIEDIVKKALSVGFNHSIGHDYFKDSEQRYNMYQNEEIVWKTDIPTLNLAFGGGLPKKTINILLGRTNIGKCCNFNTLATIRNKKTGLIEEIEIGKFFEQNRKPGLKPISFPNNIPSDLIKFEETYEIDDFEILTDTGFQPIKRIGKTIPYEKWTIKTKNHTLSCADTHIIFDSEMQEKYVKYLSPGDNVTTQNGPEDIISVINENVLENMYDIELSHENHRYWSSGFLSHNTIWLCHLAASYLSSGQNVLYVTAEMSEEKITQRIDANLLDFQMSQLKKGLDKDEFLRKVENVRKNTTGNLIIKEYPTGAANSTHIRNFMTELKQKRGVMPEIIILDYLNIFASSRLPASSSLDSYGYIKSIIEEMRGLCVEYNMIGISATQTNRAGAKEALEISLGDIADSFGMNMTADFVGALIQTDELYKQEKYLLKVLKTRYAENINEVYTIGVNRKKMRLFEPDEQDVPLSVRDNLKSQKSFVKDFEKTEAETPLRLENIFKKFS